MQRADGKPVIVLAGGDPVDRSVRSVLPRDALVIAADSGLHNAAPLGLDVDVVVGDLDSVDSAILRAAVAAGATVELHSASKDQTDLELALDAASRHGGSRIVVVGGSGGRLDHFLANALLLAAPGYAHLDVEAFVGEARVVAIHGGRGAREFAGKTGSLLTLLPIGGVARGVRTIGLVYPLDGDDLHPGSTRGVSNEFADPIAAVALDDGVLLAVQPFGGEQ